MADAGWINKPRDGLYEVQENIFTGAFRHRLHRPDVLFHEWFDGKPPYKPLQENTERQ